MSTAYELDHIKFLVFRARPKSVVDVQKVVEDYFRPVSWSLLKEEYFTLMTERERVKFLDKLFTDYTEEETNEGRRHNKVDGRR